jgi:hypothetical protein
VIAAGLRILRPCVEVATSGLGALKVELSRLDPHVVICTLPPATTGSDTTGSDDRFAWVELSLVPTRPTIIRFSDRQWRSNNLTLAGLLGVIDEAEVLLQERRACDSG